MAGLVFVMLQDSGLLGGGRYTIIITITTAVVGTTPSQVVVAYQTLPLPLPARQANPSPREEMTRPLIMVVVAVPEPVPGTMVQQGVS